MQKTKLKRIQRIQHNVEKKKQLESDTTIH